MEGLELLVKLIQASLRKRLVYTWKITGGYTDKGEEKHILHWENSMCKVKKNKRGSGLSESREGFVLGLKSLRRNHWRYLSKGML